MTGLNLAKHLGLADDLAVERGGDGEDLTRRLVAEMGVELLAHFRPFGPGARGEKAGDIPRRRIDIRCRRLNFDPIAGREHQRLMHALFL